MTPIERDHVQQVWRNARRAGRDPFDDLDNRKLLFTTEVYREVRKMAMEEVATTLELAKIMPVLRRYGRTDNTALDAQLAIVEMVRDMARREEV